MLGDERRALPVELRVFGRPRRQAIDIAVEHAECRGNQHGVVNLDVGGPVQARARHVAGHHVRPAARGLCSDDQQRLQLVGDAGLLEVVLHLDHQVLVLQMMGGDSAVNGLAVAAVVLRRGERGD